MTARATSLVLCFPVAVVLSLITAATVDADRIMLRGTSIALPECTVEAIERGRVVCLDAGGRRQRLEIDRVQAIRFDGLPLLDEAEQRIADSSLRDGVWLLLRSLVDAETDVQRLWIRRRLVQVHDALGEFAEAASHLAAIVIEDEHAHWLALKPVRDPERTSAAAVREALAALAQALRRVQHGQLRAMLESMRDRLRDLERKAIDEEGGAATDPERTLSGVPVDDIRADRPPARWQPRGAADDDAPVALPNGRLEAPTNENDEVSTPAPPPPDANRVEKRAIGAPERLERLVREQRWADALALCERVADHRGDPHDDRDSGQFLYHYGLSLRGVGRHLDAAVMFTRGALLHRDNQFAVRSLLETAEIYHRHIGRRDAAEQLLTRAKAAARAIRRDDLLELVDRMQSDLEK